MAKTVNPHTEKPDHICGKNLVDLRDYFTLWLERLEVFYNRRFEDLDAKTTLALAAADKAVTKAEIATEKRFEGVNEFRQTLADQAASLMPRAEYTSNHQGLRRDLDALAKEMQQKRETDSNRMQDSRRDRQGWMVPMIVIGTIAVINLIVNIVPLLKR